MIKILDVGCALGTFLAIARDRGFSPRGVEISQFASGFAPSLTSLLVILGVALITSKGAHGVPGSAIVILAATLTAIPDRVGEAAAHLAKSSLFLEKIGAKYDLTRATLAQAKAQIACADRSGAAETLKKAVSLARECKLEAEESAARALLAELGNA